MEDESDSGETAIVRQELYSVVGYIQRGERYPTVKMWGVYDTEEEADARMLFLTLSSPGHDAKHTTRGNRYVLWIHRVQMGPSMGGALF